MTPEILAAEAEYASAFERLTAPLPAPVMAALADVIALTALSELPGLATLAVGRALGSVGFGPEGPAPSPSLATGAATPSTGASR